MGHNFSTSNPYAMSTALDKVLRDMLSERTLTYHCMLALLQSGTWLQFRHSDAEGLIRSEIVSVKRHWARKELGYGT